MSNPVIPMSVLSGAPTREEIFDYLRAMHGVGIDEIMLYPRKGCEIEYMSEAWFTTIQNVLDGLSALGMGVWLNDDFHFPSGNANGAVTAINDYCLKAVAVCGENKGKRYFVTEETEPSRRFADVLNPDAVALFIRESHEQYWNRFEPYFGTVIRGFYTDEPCASYFCREDEIPYYTGVEDDYRACYGRDFDEDLQNETADFQKNAYALIADRFAESYGKQLSDWCRAHRVVLTGHLFDDQSPLCSALASGDILHVLPTFMMPGIDEISTKFEDRALLSLLGAAEYARGEYGAMAEIFALGPCDMPYVKQIAMVNLCASFGIDHYFFAISHMNVKGNRIINNFFNHFGPARPDFEGMKEVCRKAAKAAELARVGFKPDVYIRYPVALYTARMMEWKQEEKTGDIPFTDLINTLSHHQIGWRYLREDEDAPDDTPVVAMIESGVYTLNGEEMTLGAIVQAISKPPRVVTETGELPDGAFVRCRRDGGLTVIDLSGNGASLLIDGKPTKLEAYGVATDPITEEKAIAAVPAETPLAVRYHNDNTARMMFLNDETDAELLVREPSEVIFSVREEQAAFLDDVPIVTGVCREIGVGFDELYRSSGRMLLSPGLHHVVCGNDYKYLPSVLVSGDFAVSYQSGDICFAALSARKQSAVFGERIEDHGAVSFACSAVIPEGATAIRVFGEPLYTAASIDGKEIGRHAVAPYRFALPEGLSGTHEITVTQFSSLGSLFGDTDYFNYHQNVIRWRSTKPSHPSVFGIDRIEFS